MLILTFGCFALVAYVYFGYPFLLWCGAFGRRRPLRRGPTQELISIIVPAHNEEAAIEAKLRNLLASNFPREQVEILIGSDGSSDRTEEIVRQFKTEGVGLVSFPQQHGKSAIQNGLVAVSSGSILVFTDADCLFSPDALDHLVENFADSRVGLVTGRPEYSNARETNISTNESSYLRYETWMRERESQRGILAVASGSLFGLRRSLWKQLPSEFGDDFVLPLHVANEGFLNVLDSRVISTTRLTQNKAGSMLRMKSRIIGKDLRALMTNRKLLNPMRHGSLAIGLWSHKLLRWLVPFFLILMLASSLFAPHSAFSRAFLAFQIGFYAIALAGFSVRNRALAFPWSVPTSFCIVNCAALLGVLKCISGRTSGLWKPERAPRHSRQVVNAEAAPESK